MTNREDAEILFCREEGGEHDALGKLKTPETQRFTHTHTHTHT